MQQIQHLQQSKQELHDQVEHWKYRAEAAMEQKAIGALSTDQDSQGTSATEEILLDIKKLQQVVACDFVLCRVRRQVNFCLTFGWQSEAYWRQQAKTLVHEYEEAEGDVRKMIREMQRGREVLRGKEASEKKLREEVDFLQKVCERKEFICPFCSILPYFATDLATHLLRPLPLCGNPETLPRLHSFSCMVPHFKLDLCLLHFI